MLAERFLGDLPGLHWHWPAVKHQIAPQIGSRGYTASVAAKCSCSSWLNQRANCVGFVSDETSLFGKNCGLAEHVVGLHGTCAFEA